MKVVEIQTPTTTDEQSIYEYIAKCSSVVRDKEPANPERLWNRLWEESYGNLRSRVLEYVPVTLVKGEMNHKAEKLYGYMNHTTGQYRTSMREVGNWGKSLDEAIEAGLVNFNGYKAFTVMAPRFVYNQLQTHNNVTSVCFSARYSDNHMGYWYPEEFAAFTEHYKSTQELWNAIVENYSPKEIRNFMKNELGIKRKEVYSRGADSLEYVKFTLGGYTDVEESWKHFVNQRLDAHTQKETREVAKMISDKLYQEVPIVN